MLRQCVSYYTAAPQHRRGNGVCATKERDQRPSHRTCIILECCRFCTRYIILYVTHL